LVVFDVYGDFGGWRLELADCADGLAGVTGDCDRVHFEVFGGGDTEHGGEGAEYCCISVL